MSRQKHIRLARAWLESVVMLTALAAAGAQPAAAQRARTPGDTGTITGVIHDNVGNPVVGAQVIAAGLRATSDSAGKFTVRNLPIGLVMLSVQRIGYHRLVAGWNVEPTALSLELTLDPVPLTLPAVLVRSRREPYDGRLAGFNARRQQGLGIYITRDQIDKMNTYRLIDALTKIPGVRAKTMRGALGRTVTLPGAHCPPMVFVDGFPASMGSFDLDMLDLSTVEGVEVYPSGSTVPPDFMGPYGTESCGVIAVWSRPMRPQTRADQLPPEHVDIDSLLADHTVYLGDAVDTQAMYVEQSVLPVYPDSLYRAHVPGRVVARFVVDTTGRVEVGTVQILSATNSAFSKAVQEVIGGAKFTPAVLKGHAVRSLVDMPFDFSNPKVDSVGKGG